MSDLRSDLEALAPEVDLEDGWRRVEAALPTRRSRRRRNRLLVAVAGTAAAVAVVMLTLPGPSPMPTLDTAPTAASTTLPPRTSSTTPSVTETEPGVDSADSPSQSPGDAARDGVIPELAAIPLDIRADRLWEHTEPEGTWVVAQPTEQLIDRQAAINTDARGADAASPCRMGDPVDDTRAICVGEYGEILLLDRQGRQVVRAYPFPGAPPDWVLVGPEALYSGHVGDGGLPFSTLVRIDRTTLEPEVWIMPAPDGSTADFALPSWHQADDRTAYQQLVKVGNPTGRMIAADSWLNPVAVDLDGLRRFFNP